MTTDSNADGAVDLESVTRLYAMLGAVGGSILAAEDRGDLYDALCQALVAPGDFHLAWVGVLQPNGAMVPVARAGTPPRYVTTNSDTGEARTVLPKQAADTGSTVVVNNLWAGEPGEDWDTLRANYGVGSACFVPIRFDGEPIAVLNTYMAEQDAYDEARVQLLELMVEGVAYALRALSDRQAHEVARLARTVTENELAARSAMHAELARLGQLAFKTDDLAGLFAEITESAHQVMDLDLVVMEELANDGELRLVASSGIQDGVPVGRSFPLDHRSFSNRLLRNGDALAIADLPVNDPPVRFSLAPDMRAAVGVVVRSRQRAHAVLMGASRTPRLIPAVEVDFLRSLAHIAGAAIDHHAASRRLLEQALHDPLTGLPNRTLLFERLEQAATHLAPGRQIGVLLIDLDGFKLVNDALGHDTGDELLRAVAARITHIVREGDLVARLGGDEFAVLCADLDGIDDATEVAERLAEALRSPFDLDPVQMYVTASIGITLHDGPASSPRALLRAADIAMYAAKDEGRARYQVYDDGMRKASVERLGLINDLRRALERDEFELEWHPIVSVVDDTLVRHGSACLEALLRWNHPEKGRLGPDAFIGVAEETGLIVPIGEWVLRAACRQMAAWRRLGGAGCPDLISVNLSAHQLARPEIVDEIVAISREEGIEPSAIVLEVTETAFMRDEERALSRLEQLSRAGFFITIDDFGTGYSSLAYLRDLPARGLKIDRSFVARLSRDCSDSAIVDAIVSLAHAVGLIVVAEGVETDEQLELLREMGCDRAQGYLWTRPLPAAEVPAWLAAYRTPLEASSSGASVTEPTAGASDRTPVG